GNDSNEVTWFVFEYEYTDSSYHGVSRQFALVLAKTGLNMPLVSVCPCNARGRLTIADFSGADLSYLSTGPEQRFAVKDPNPPSADQVLTAKVVETLLHLPDYDYAFSGPY